MRLPIQRMADGTLYITIDFEDTPRGFEDAMENSTFRKNLLRGLSMGEFNAPDASALAGNELGTLHRMVNVDESRACLMLYEPMPFANRYLQIKIRPWGRLGTAFKMAMDANPLEDQYVSFRLKSGEDEESDELTVTEIYNLDYTPVQRGRYNKPLI